LYGIRHRSCRHLSTRCAGHHLLAFSLHCFVQYFATGHHGKSKRRGNANWYFSVSQQRQWRCRKLLLGRFGTHNQLLATRTGIGFEWNHITYARQNRRWYCTHQAMPSPTVCFLTTYTDLRRVDGCNVTCQRRRAELQYFDAGRLFSAEQFSSARTYHQCNRVSTGSW
jgi:hypothetical protein